MVKRSVSDAARRSSGRPARFSSSPASFEEEVARELPPIQDLLQRLLETYCSAGQPGITEIGARFGIHRKLAWQIRNVAYSRSPLQAASAMPSHAGWSSLVTALQAQSMAKDLLPALEQAGERFARMMTAHAGDRTRMDLLVHSQLGSAPVASGDRERSEVRWREKAYLGNSFIWGAQAKLTLGLSILGFSPKKRDYFDVAQIRGLVGLRRMRPNLHWVVNQSVVVKKRKRVHSPKRRPLDPEAARAMDGVPILPRFSSLPCPSLRRRLTMDGMLNDELLPAPVGVIGQQTVITGEVLRELAPRHAIQEGQRAHFGVVSRTPSEVLLLDHFVHRELFPEVKHELCVFSELNSPVTMAEDDRLPVAERIEEMGAGIGAARTADIPGYLEMLRWLFEQLEWDPAQFDLHRVRLQYPPVPSSVMIRHAMPEKSVLKRAARSKVGKRA